MKNVDAPATTRPIFVVAGLVVLVVLGLLVLLPSFLPSRLARNEGGVVALLQGASSVDSSLHAFYKNLSCSCDEDGKSTVHREVGVSPPTETLPESPFPAADVIASRYEYCLTPLRCRTCGKANGICAYPEDYRRSAINTYVLDSVGAVFRGDTKGFPASHTSSEAAYGWMLVGPDVPPENATTRSAGGR